MISKKYDLTVFRKRLTAKVNGIVITHSCYDLCVMIAQLKELNVEDTEEIETYFLLNCEYLEPVSNIDRAVQKVCIADNGQISMF